MGGFSFGNRRQTTYQKKGLIIIMEFERLICERYSVRSYKACGVEEEKLSEIIRAATLAPTACNNHPERVICVKGQAMERLASVRSVFGAPTALAVCYDPKVEWKNKRMGGKGSGEVDAAIVTTYMMLRAWELGLGSCWIGSFDGEAVKAALGIDPKLQLVAILALGYPAEDSQPIPMHYENPKAEDISAEI